MGHLYLIVPLFFVTIVLGMIIPSFASAADVWLVKGVAINNGMVDANIFTLANSLILYEDMNTGVDLLCPVEGLEWLLPMGLTEVVDWECIEPIVMAGQCGSVKVVAVHLPWNTEIVSEGGSLLDDVTTGTGGAPGLSFECTVLGIKVTDECTTEHLKPLMINSTEGVVEEQFIEEEPEVERYNCSLGGGPTGLVVGNVYREALVNNILETAALSAV